MADYSGIGVIQPQMRVPIAEMRRRFGGTAAVDDATAVDTFERLLALFEIMPSREWNLFFNQLGDAASGSGGGGGTGTLYADLTPAATVVPQLDYVAEDGTLGILLDRATTTIDPATYNGVTPEDGWKFALMFTNDATDGRDIVFDAAYVGVTPPSGMAGAVEIYHFRTRSGIFYCDYQAIALT